jgi:two-component sensor histidine kinase/PAS domain-containing protein
MDHAMVVLLPRFRKADKEKVYLYIYIRAFMEEASKIESGRWPGFSGFVPSFSYDLHSVIPLIVYLIVYATFPLWFRVAYSLDSILMILIVWALYACLIAAGVTQFTATKKKEERLRATAEMLSMCINHLHSGVMVEDEARKITHVNQAFSTLFNVPVSVQTLFGVDSRLLLVQTAPFAERIEQIILAGIPVFDEELALQEKVVLRNYVPLQVNKNTRYHLWQYQDITEIRHAEEHVNASLKEKEVLLKEIHHRVKNNLQIISSLLNLQSNEIADPQASQKFRESQDRVKAMALIHERLYQSSDLANIDFYEYIRSLAGHLLRSYKVNVNCVRLYLDVEPIPMNIDIAIPCGLIINELVSNSLKYAFPNDREGEIKICLIRENSNLLKLDVRDNGIGFDEPSHLENSDSLGLKLVRTLAEQINGTLRYSSRGGFVCEIEIPCENVK